MTKRNPDPERAAFYRRTFKIMAPIIFQNILNAAVQSADVVMLNYVGQSSMAAVSLATQFSGILYMFLFGLGTGVTMLCAQYYGKRDIKAIHVVEGIALRFSLGGAAVFAGLAFFAPQLIMKIFTSDQELIDLGIPYLRHLSVGYLCWGVIEIYMSILRSTGRTTVTMTLNAMALTLNIGLNAVFIFGLFGMPKMGIVGVAMATVTSRLIELIGCILVSLRSKDVKLNPGFIFIRNKLLLKDFIRLALPALANDMSWSIAFSMYAVILGHLGSDVVATNSVVSVVRDFGTVFCAAGANATGIILGQTIGDNRLKEAKVYANRFVWLAVINGVIGAGLILASIPVVMRFVNFSDTAMYYLKYMLMMHSFSLIGSALNSTMISGVFRSGGDSRFGLICDSLIMWCYAVPTGFIVAFALKLPVLWVYFILRIDEFVKLPWVIRHFRSGKWLKNITRDNLFD